MVSIPSRVISPAFELLLIVRVIESDVPKTVPVE
jgi:hypothetical protein